ncbi:CFEM domain-containing protein [Aspergillus ruber CBS 135680]|uniref:CFEM-domain-containing protein n=1 Tax=Aspergillus ruber (strain CBS 135680) TaxID=1388766 RepID=A0A017SIA4_ASPRC|nr:CFEM-domain-containing protein [Aspergillus ruber CBS 135680]EYE96394.1 CFEM-domain-containing protein [Aspergillus ruber CBS 135680]
MRFTQVVAALAATGLASAQIPDVPSCSLQCFLDSLSNDGCSELTDFACHCTKPQLPQEITPCVEKACSEADQSAVSSAVVQECSAAGHPISLPPVGGSNVSRSEATATASSDSSAVGDTPSSAVASSSAVATGSSSGAIPSASASSSNSGSSSAPPLYTGAASNMKCSIAGAAAVAAAAVYAA